MTSVSVCACVWKREREKRKEEEGEIERNMRDCARYKAPKQVKRGGEEKQKAKQSSVRGCTGMKEKGSKKENETQRKKDKREHHVSLVQE